MRRAFAALVMLATAAPLADAQIFDVPRRSTLPAFWASASAGFLSYQNDVVDGRTESVWRIGSALQYRGSLEYDVGNSGSVGMAVGYADVPMTYFQLSPPGSQPDCPDRCDASGTVWTVMGTFHMGGGRGFHQIIDLSAGTTVYRDFRSDELGSPLGPTSPDKDISIAVGYGFGWGFSERLHVMLVQDVAYTMHQRDGISGGQNSSSQQFVTRLGVRAGLGSRTR